jgi:hypothetical protein
MKYPASTQRHGKPGLDHERDAPGSSNCHGNLATFQMLRAKYNCIRTRRDAPALGITGKCNCPNGSNMLCCQSLLLS